MKQVPVFFFAQLKWNFVHQADFVLVVIVNTVKKEIKKLKKKDVNCNRENDVMYRIDEYLALADQLSEYIVKLLDKVRGHDELEILLNKKGRDSDDETYELLSRLKLAIHYNEKKVSLTQFDKENTSIK
jgi:MFS superfamily sulfate permease-like transporter